MKKIQCFSFVFYYVSKMETLACKGTKIIVLRYIVEYYANLNTLFDTEGVVNSILSPKFDILGNPTLEIA